MKQQHSTGFTLIELLVVIAIIGILSSVVLASLNTARAKGADAAVKAALSNIRAEAEIYYDNTSNTYGAAYTASACPSSSNTSMFWADAQIQAGLAQAASAGGGGMSGTRCATDGNDYAISIRLKSNTANYWCVDSTGAAKIITNASWTGVACP